MTYVGDNDGHGGGVLAERLEEALEALWTVAERLAEERGAWPEVVTRAELGPEAEQAEALAEARMVTLEGDAIRFTEAGHAAARGLIRRHRLGERLVADVLDLHGEIVEEYACRVEHMVHPGLEERICTLLGHPRVCPHGNPIPRGECCREDKQEVGQAVVKLVDLHPGQRGTIAYLHSEDRTRVNKLIAMGVLPGAEVQLRRRIPTFVFQVGFSQFAVDEQVARSVFVRLEG